jgi:hypothetical protein
VFWPSRGRRRRAMCCVIGRLACPGSR